MSVELAPKRESTVNEKVRELKLGTFQRSNPTISSIRYLVDSSRMELSQNILP